MSCFPESFLGIFVANIKGFCLFFINLLFSDPSTPLPIEVKLKVSGPSEVRFNEPAAFRCSANRKDVEVTISLDSNWVQTAFGKAEFMLKPGEIQHGLRQFVLNCFALDDNNDKITISHYVDVLCKFVCILKSQFPLVKHATS